MATLAVSARECEALLDYGSLVPALERAHVQLSRGEAASPAPPMLRDPRDDSVDGPGYLPMTAFAPYLDRVAVKLLADMPRNRSSGLPAQRSTVALYDARTAECLALVDGRALTRMRTAAVTAVASRALARPGAGVLGLVGAGALALAHVAAHAAVLDLERVVVWSRSARSRELLAESVAATGLAADAVAGVGDVLAAADVVCTLTPALEPLVHGGDVRPGTHLNAVGSPPRPAYRELAPEVLARADVVAVDHLPVALQESGNVRAAVESGLLDPRRIVELGAVLDGRGPGRRSADEVTVFNSVGIALQDLAAAELVRSAALERGLGTTVRLRD